MKIALIEDHPTSLLLYSKMLLKSNAAKASDTILPFFSAGEFYNHCKSCTDYANDLFDVVISDHNLGRDSISGYDLLSNFQSTGFNGLAILLTSDNSSEMKDRMEKTPNIEYVLKGAKNQEDNPYVILKRLIDNIRQAQENKCTH